MAYQFAESWKFCTVEAKRWTYRLSGTFPRYSTSPAYARLEDDRGNVVEHLAAEGEDDARPMDEFDVSLDVDLPVGSTEINLEMHIPDDASSAPGNVRFRMMPHPIRVYRGGSIYPIDCLQTQEPERFTLATWDINVRSHLLHAARICQLIYSNINEAIAQAERIGLDDDEYASLPLDNRPGSGVVVHRSAERVMVCIAGSTTSAQLIAQGVQMTQGVQDFGMYDTMPLWRTATNIVFPVLTAANVQGNTPLVLVGHSMGGAIACAAACLLRLTQPQRRIELLTFGMPRPGGVKMSAMLRTLTQRHVRNQGDVICKTCPHPEELGYLSALIPEPVFSRLKSWETPFGCWTLDNAGGLVAGTDNGVKIWQFAAIVAPWIAGGAIPQGTEHSMAEYVRRLELQ